MAQDAKTRTVVRFRRGTGDELPEPSDAGLPSVGKTFGGRYLVISEIGAGGHGAVYRVKDLQLDREVALKIMRPDYQRRKREDSLSAEHMLAEARMVAQLQHPNIVPVHDTGELDGMPFLVMGLVQGRTLAEMLDDGPLPWKRACDIIAQVCDALDHAHAHGVVHRDIKPSNILVEPGDHVRVVDFGVARRRRELKHADQGSVFGTVGYIAPEVWMGGTPGPRSDLFSVGVCLYTMVTGDEPFRGDTVEQIVDAILRASPAAPDTVGKGVSRAAARVVMRSIARKPEDRFPDGRALVRALRRVTWNQMAGRRIAVGALAAATIAVVAVPIAYWRGLELRVDATIEGESQSVVAGKRVRISSSPTGTVLHSGDSFWIDKVSSNHDAWVYALILDSTGRVSRLFPADDVDLTLPLRKGKKYRIPPKGSWELDKNSGAETIFLAASPNAIAPDKLVEAVASSDAASRQAEATVVADASAPSPVRTRGVSGLTLTGAQRDTQEREVEKVLSERFAVLRKYHIIHE